MSTLQTTAITPPMTFDQARDRGVVGMVEHEPPRQEITMGTPNLEQIAALRPELSNYKGDGSTMDYINDLNAYADGLENALRAVAQPEPKRFLAEKGTGVGPEEDDLYMVKPFREWFDRCWPQPPQHSGKWSNWKHRENIAWAAWVAAEQAIAPFLAGGERLRQAELLVARLSVQLSAVLTAVSFGTFTDRKNLMAENALTEAAKFIDAARAATTQRLLADFSSQKLACEMSEDDLANADFEGAYDHMVKEARFAFSAARAAITPSTKESP